MDRLEAAQLDLTPGSAAVPAMAAPLAQVTIEAVGGPAPWAVLLVNSRPAAAFGSGRVTVGVGPGDLLEIDGRAYRRRLTFRVVGVDPGLAAPSAGQEVATVGDIGVLARARARA